MGKKTHGGGILLVKLQAKVCSFTKSNTPPWVVFMFLKLYKWYQIARSVTNKSKYLFKVRCVVAQKPWKR